MSSDTPEVVCLHVSGSRQPPQPVDQPRHYRSSPNVPTNCGSPDWDDEVRTTILRRCREAVTTAGSTKLVVIERVLPQRVAPEHLDLVLSDLNMMAMTCGRERTEAEFAELFDRTGFRLDRVVPTGTNVSIVEATPVPVAM
jgi:hypothetical protein